jgi:hypothetical protein
VQQLSASGDNTTTDPGRLARQDPAGWGYGHTSLLFCGAGIIVLVVAFSAAYQSPLTVGAITWLALSVTLTLGGLQGARWAFGRQRAKKVEATFAEDVASLEHHTIGTSTKLQEWLDAEKTQGERSKEARDRLERMERSLIAIDAKLADAEIFGQHLVALADRMEALEKRQEEMLNLMVARTTLNAQPNQQHRTPRQRKRRRQDAEAAGENVVPIRSRRAADALRRLTEQIKDEPNA